MDFFITNDIKKLINTEKAWTFTVLFQCFIVMCSNSCNCWKKKKRIWSKTSQLLIEEKIAKISENSFPENSKILLENIDKVHLNSQLYFTIPIKKWYNKIGSKTHLLVFIHQKFRSKYCDYNIITINRIN